MNLPKDFVEYMDRKIVEHDIAMMDAFANKSVSRMYLEKLLNSIQDLRDKRIEELSNLTGQTTQQQDSQEAGKSIDWLEQAKGPGPE